MKANNGKGNNPSRDEWETPSKLFDPLNKQYGFVFDCCANRENHKCESWSSNFETYEEVVDHLCWMNPPVSIARRMFEQFFKVVKKNQSG